MEDEDRSYQLTRALSQCADRLKELKLDGPTLPAVRRKVIEQMGELYPDIDSALIEDSATFAAFLAFLWPRSKKYDYWEILDYRLKKRPISALDLAAYRHCCDLWPGEYFRTLSDAVRMVHASDEARRRARTRHEKSDKAAAKESIHQSWTRWQRCPNLYSSKSAFSLAMLDIHQILTNQQTIERWCRTWEREYVSADQA